MGQESEFLSVSTSSVTISFTTSVYYVEIYNSGTNTCFISFGVNATVNHFPLASGETMALFGDIDDVRAICDATHSAYLHIIGTR